MNVRMCLCERAGTCAYLQDLFQQQLREFDENVSLVDHDLTRVVQQDVDQNESWPYYHYTSPLGKTKICVCVS